MPLLPVHTDKLLNMCRGLSPGPHGDCAFKSQKTESAQRVLLDLTDLAKLFPRPVMTGSNLRSVEHLLNTQRNTHSLARRIARLVCDYPDK